MTYTLHNGYTVRAIRVDDGFEFETRNTAGETISTARVGYGAAHTLMTTLRRAAR